MIKLSTLPTPPLVPKAEDYINMAARLALPYARRGKNVEDTDQYSDALLGLTKALAKIEQGKYDPTRAGISTFIFKCMQSAIISGHRQRQRKQFFDLMGSDVNSIVDEQDDLIDVDIDELLQDVPDYSEADRLDILILKRHYLDGETWKEIGDNLGFSRARAQKRGKRAIELLRAKLN